DVRLWRCVSDLGGGSIFVDLGIQSDSSSTTLKMLNCKITECTSKGQGGGIYLQGLCEVLNITRSYFDQNRALVDGPDSITPSDGLIRAQKYLIAIKGNY
ncbi:MAG: hypothetical protein EZS28_054385, partial [Streblomastix strix]